MEILVTGNLRDIANSAWISTTDEVNTHMRTDEDVERVTSFLAKNMHTSPYECVTITFKTKNRSDLGDEFINNKYSKLKLFADDTYLITIDLLNFAKIYKKHPNLKACSEFAKNNSELISKISLFDFENFGDPSEKIKEECFKDINVELINCHETEFHPHNRITWRVRCPLSIAVQALRHRTASFNMVSGRYKTIKQEPVLIPNDIKKIVSVSDILQKKLKIMNSDMILAIKNYTSFMEELKHVRRDNIISNSEYKRMREFVRFSLPEGRMTELYVTFYQEDFEHFLKLRDSDHAQIEHIYLAQKMKETLNNYYENKQK